LSVSYLTWDVYEKTALKNMGSHWKSYKERWEYYDESLKIIKTLNIKNPKDVLEIGPLDNNLVKNSDSMDFNNERWDFKTKPTYLHDMRNIPWPIRDKQYKLCIALRVFHHLYPHQEACFREAARICDYLLIVVPSKTKQGLVYEKLTTEPNRQVILDTSKQDKPNQAQITTHTSKLIVNKKIKFGNSKLFFWSF